MIVRAVSFQDKAHCILQILLRGGAVPLAGLVFLARPDSDTPGQGGFRLSAPVSASIVAFTKGAARRLVRATDGLVFSPDAF